MTKPVILIVTQLYPESSASYAGTFVVDLLRHLEPRFQFVVLVPTFPPLLRSFLLSRAQEQHHGGRIIFFIKYAPDEAIVPRLVRRWKEHPSSEQLHFQTKKQFAKRLLTLAQQLHTHNHFSLVHGHEAFYGDEAAPIGRVLNIPSIVTIHGLSQYHEQGWGSASIAAILNNLRKATALTSVSRLAAESYTNRLQPPVPPLTIIPNGYDPEEPKPLSPKWISAIAGRKVILAVGTFSPEKRFRTLIDATDSLRKRLGNIFVVVLIGHGAEQILLQRLVRARGLNQQVLFAGTIPPADMPSWYTVATVLAHPSIIESFSMVVLEAMSYGRPVILTSAIGITEYLQPDEAIIVPPDNATAFEAALGTLLQNDALAQSIGKKAQARSQQFRWKHLAPRWDTLYGSLTK